MGIKLDIGDLGAEIRKAKEKVEHDIIEALKYCGEQAVNYARKHGTYKDHTANLRSSIHYIVAKNGDILASSEGDDPLSVTDENGETHTGDEGKATGLAYARDLSQQEKNGFVLVVVAGMQYAEYVERRGYDVLAGAQIETEGIFKQVIEQL